MFLDDFVRVHDSRESFIKNQKTLSERTALTVDDITLLLTLCLNAIYFSFQGIIYQQIFVTAMGSPVSVVIANLVMKYVEEKALSTSPWRIQFGRGMLMMFSARYQEMLFLNFWCT